MRKAKIEEIQSLRALAFLAVVFQHAVASYVYDAGVQLADGATLSLLLLVSKFAVPLFVFITGLVLFYNYDGELRYGSFVYKRFQDILLPYLFWTGVYFAWKIGWDQRAAASLLEFLRLAVTGKASYHLWYIVMIFQFYLLFPLFRSLVHAVKKERVTTRRAVALLAVLAVCYSYLMTLIPPIHTLAEQWGLPVISPMFSQFADRNALYFVYYFLLGAAAGLAIGGWREWLERYRWWVGLAFAGMFGYFSYRMLSHFQLKPEFQVNLNDLFLLRPVMAFYLIASILAIYLLAMRMSAQPDSIWNRAMNLIGIYSYGAYLMHALVLNRTVWLIDLGLPAVNVTLRTLLAFAVCSLLSLLFTMLLAKLPFGKVTAGVGKLGWKS